MKVQKETYLLELTSVADEEEAIMRTEPVIEVRMSQSVGLDHVLQQVSLLRQRAVVVRLNDRRERKQILQRVFW